MENQSAEHLDPQKYTFGQGAESLQLLSSRYILYAMVASLPENFTSPTELVVGLLWIPDQNLQYTFTRLERPLHPLLPFFRIIFATYK